MPNLQREPEIFPADLFVNGHRHLPWWVAHVRPRREKAFSRLLRVFGVPHYLPQREHAVRRDGRRRVSWLPLFTGYVFFRGNGVETASARRTNAIVRIVDVESQAELDRQLCEIWRLQLAGATLVPHPCLGPGDAVEVVDGPFRGYRGRVLREAGRLRLVVSIDLIRQAVAVELDREVLAPDGDPGGVCCGGRRAGDRAPGPPR
jgi:transcriptional antiterminator RfaH